MYRNGSEYGEMDRLIYSIYMDYHITKFPIDPKDVCRKFGVALVPYSAFISNDSEKLLKKKSKQAFFVRESKENPPTIYYNDNHESEGSIRLSIFHELKHYVCGDKNDEDDDLADYFGRHFMCPTAYIMKKVIDTPNAIVAFCGVSFEAACYASSNVRKRREKCGLGLMTYEQEYIEMVEPIVLESITPDPIILEVG